MKIKLRKLQVLACVCALQLSACAMVQEDTQAPLELLSPTVLAMIQQDAVHKTKSTEDVNPDAISIEELLKNALGQPVDVNTVAVQDTPSNSVPVPSRKPDMQIG